MRIKPVVIVLLVITMATMICSGVGATDSPQSLLRDLKETVKAGDDHLFRGYVITYTHQQKNALLDKIDATIGLYDVTDHEEAAAKLRDDIAPKLTDPHDANGHPSARAKSWLYMYPDDCPERRAVTAFATQCQQIIEEILMDQPK